MNEKEGGVIEVTVQKKYNKVEGGTRTPEEQIKFAISMFEDGKYIPGDLAFLLGETIAEHGRHLIKLIPKKVTSKLFGTYEVKILN